MENVVGLKINRTLVLGILLIVSLFVAGFFWFKWYKNNYQVNSGNNTNPTAQSSKKSDFKVDTKQLSKTQTLVGIPNNLPIEPGAKILQSTESRASDGRVQTIKKFTSQLKVDSALAKYAKFFEDLGWKPNTTKPLKSPALLLQGNNVLMIIVDKDPANVAKQGSVVELIYLQNPPQVVKK